MAPRTAKQISEDMDKEWEKWRRRLTHLYPGEYEIEVAEAGPIEMGFLMDQHAFVVTTEGWVLLLGEYMFKTGGGSRYNYVPPMRARIFVEKEGTVISRAEAIFIPSPP